MERPPKFVAVLRARLARRPREARVVGQATRTTAASFPPWRPFQHPQLGAVEIGGIDPRVGIWNPPLHELADRCARRRRRCSCASPRSRRALRIARDRSQARCPAARRASRSRSINDGYLGSYGMPSARRSSTSTSRSTRPRDRGCELVDPGMAHQVLGHLDGWGHGLHTGANLPAYPGTRGTTNAAWATYLVKGGGALEVRIGCARTGFVTAQDRGVSSWRLYAIGDIQGCMASLERLLALIELLAARDRLWLVGDLVNRGPRSLDVLRWAHEHGDVGDVRARQPRHPPARARRRRRAAEEARHARRRARAHAISIACSIGCAARPLLHVEGDLALVHAGLHPRWTIDDAKARACRDRARAARTDVARVPRAAPGSRAALGRPARRRRPLARDPRVPRARTNAQARWSRRARLRRTARASTRGLRAVVSRFRTRRGRRTPSCSVTGPRSASTSARITSRLDTGCVWGRSLTALRLDDRMVFQVKAVETAS